MPTPNGLSLLFWKAAAPRRVAAWSDWLDTTHLHELTAAGHATRASRWEVVFPNRLPYTPTLGFNEVCIADIPVSDPAAHHNKLVSHLQTSQRDGKLNPYHYIADVMTFQPQGRWAGRPAPSTASTGQFFVFNRTNDPKKLAEWHAWLDDVHLPEVLATGRFHGVSRWSRVHPTAFGPNYLVIFDVREPDNTAGIIRVIEANHDWERRHVPDWHSGALMFLTRPAGKHGAVGYTLKS